MREMLRACTLQKAVTQLNQYLKNHPSVVYLGPVSCSLGRHLQAHGVASLGLAQPGNGAVKQKNSALILCNTLNRPHYEDELGDVRSITVNRLKMEVFLIYPSTVPSCLLFC